MSKKKHRRDDKGSDSAELAKLSEIARLLKILIGLSLHAIEGERSQKDMVLLLASAGCGHAEIAELLGIPGNSVGPALSRGRKKR